MKAFPLLPSPSSLLNTFSFFFFFFNPGVSLVFPLQKYGTDLNFKSQLLFTSDDALGLKSVLFLPRWFQRGWRLHLGSVSAKQFTCAFLCYCIHVSQGASCVGKTNVQQTTRHRSCIFLCFVFHFMPECFNCSLVPLVLMCSLLIQACQS